VASHEATDKIPSVEYLAPYLPSGMVVAIAVESITSYLIDRIVAGDDHGEEAVVGRRDANWACGNSAVTNILLLSAVWVVGAVFADRNAPALGGILNQQGVGNSTVTLLGSNVPRQLVSKKSISPLTRS